MPKIESKFGKPPSCWTLIHACPRPESDFCLTPPEESSHSRRMRRRWRLRFGESPLEEWTHRYAQLQDPKRTRFAAKAPAQSGDAVQIARAAFLVDDLETSGVVPRKYCGCECAHPLETIWRVCLSDGTLQYAQFLARGAHESAQDGSHGVLLAPIRAPAKGRPARLRACVGVVEPCTRGVFVGMCMNAPFRADATLVMVV